MTARTLELADEAATVALGQAIGQALKARPEAFTIFLEGDLGAGKTTLCRGLLQAFGHSGAVKSPTYTLVELYELADRRIHHFDLYRLGDPEELEYMGIRDYFGPGHICVLEWPERGTGVLPAADLRVKVTTSGPGRRAQLSADSSAGQSLINELPAGMPD
ncbi:tRNA (adenosine(37)-N6)-threonylcarbamoyltransferase complex ATPase subunit type 1 TsaE [Marinimicrobium sp. ABcell2]|uniref:tRNA (adenosine(37)-N6)-threonylcarbamoyltransferase complex ATPase subunit type 1 TsaE n=1 Tax=Marinimicrobium sp. ABcell2 TaxID=3069751 RepID=UPI0027AE876B|nr:tRNA (adenosine(37)-N6)-threonylcarbamoyltransferase complex ATPase subunit type 1 TsaE [Marinimicrobium sp. ABcell2]MDQ2076373.1 tRNA (adenosine(37)-N6)-threonylcarbamoyltransferase complex ATPase subunit type 1 TsaE [Marinimicrobium sp. ABcell2]